MRRSSARVDPDYWRQMADAGLSAPARTMFVHALTSATVSPAGVLPITIQRWATLTGLSVEDVDAAVSELDAAGFVVVDELSQEMLIRCFWALNAPDRHWDSKDNIRLHIADVVSERIRATALGKE